MSRIRKKTAPLPNDPEDVDPAEISDDTIAEKAAEIARSRGRDEPAEADWATALARLGVTKKGAAAPELSEPGMGEITEWDEPATSSGGAVPEVLPDDESTVASKFVEEGLDEAERDLRAATDEEEKKA